MMRIRRLVQTPRGAPALSVLSLPATALALRETSIDLDFAVVEGRLRLNSYGMTATEGQWKKRQTDPDGAAAAVAEPQ